MPATTPAAAAALDGPAWLTPRRIEAAERATAAPWPTAADEIWRYSRIDDLDLERYVLATPDDRRAVPAGAAAVVASVPERAATVVVVDGRVVQLDVRPDLAAKGLRVGPVDDEGDADLLGAVAAPVDVFAEWSVALAARPLVVDVPAGLVVDAPVVVVQWAAQDGAATFSRLVVRAGADSELRLLDHAGSDDVAALTVPLVELDAAPAARLRYLAVNTLGPQVWQIANQVARGDADSTTLVSNVALGGEYARVRCDARLVGRGATGDQVAVYFGERSQMHDFRTLQEHAAPKTTSNLLFKGAVQDTSRSVYSGVIHVGKEAPGTNAFQTNRTVKLSEGSWAESVPNLEIETNDVRCSHASTVGPIDAEQRFYLESRGVPPHVAERLVVLGFFEEVLERLPVDVGPAVRAEVASRLERRLP